MTELFPKIISRRSVRSLTIGVALVAMSQPVYGQRNATAACGDHDVKEAFGTAVRTWSLEQLLLTNRLVRGHERPGPWWSVLNVQSIVRAETELAAGAQRRQPVPMCQADFRYWDTPIAMMSGSAHQFRINSIAYRVTPAPRGGKPNVEILNLPSSINDDPELVAMADRISIASIPLPKLIEMLRADRKPITGQTHTGAAISATPARPRAQTEAFAGALAETFAQYNQELEAEMRRQGAGDIVDAERARRAALTPKERAAEDAWNLGPRKGEIMCREEHGVTRCKTGR